MPDTINDRLRNRPQSRATIADDDGKIRTIGGQEVATSGAPGTGSGMTPAQQAKLDGLPTGEALAAAQAAQDTAIAGKASLIGGKLDPAQVPDIALQQYLGAAANEAAMLALAGQLGDWCTRSDTGTDWRIVGNPSMLAGWLQTAYPSAPVSSVNGKTGAVGLGKADVGLGNVDNTSDVNKPVSNAQALAIAAKIDGTLSALQSVFDGGTAAQKAAFKSSVLGAGNTYIRWCCPGKDTSGTVFKDVSGRGNDATIEASNGTPFAVDNRISTVAHASAGGVVQSLAATLCDFTADSIIMAVEFARADPAASEAIMAFGAASGAGFPGFYFSHRSSAAGVGRVIANRGNGTLVSGADTTVKFSNAGGTRPTHAVMAYDAPTRSMYLYRDGVLAAANAAALSGANDWTINAPTIGARIGGSGGASQTYAGSWRGWQAYVFSGRGLPLNIGRIAALLAESPCTPLRDYEFAF